jgi:hypothetical protein
MTKICPGCDSDFTPRKARQVYCSPVCVRAKTVEGKTLDRICINPSCHKEFTVDRKSSKKKYCSSSCASTVNNTLFPKRSVDTDRTLPVQRRNILDLELAGSCHECKVPVRKDWKYCEVHNPNLRLYSLTPVINTCLHCHRTYSSFFITKKLCQDCQEKANTNPVVYESTQCPNCGEDKKPFAEHCQACYNYKKTEKTISQWQAGEVEGGSVRKIGSLVRAYLLEKCDFACPGCGFNTLHPSDGSTVLEIDHIDGNGENHAPSNLRVLCPNCHALTPTYRGRNSGNGRKVYYTRQQIQ